MIPKSVASEIRQGMPSEIDQKQVISASGPVGLACGTRIWTADGALPIEYVVPGDRVVARDHGLITINKIIDHHALTRVIRLDPDCFGVGRPNVPVCLPAAQPVLVRGSLAQQYAGSNTLLVAAQTLVDWRVATDLGRSSLRLFTPVFETSQILYCSGLEVACLTTGR